MRRNVRFADQNSNVIENLHEKIKDKIKKSTGDNVVQMMIGDYKIKSRTVVVS